jgi:hypothetical protein
MDRSPDHLSYPARNEVCIVSGDAGAALAAYFRRCVDRRDGSLLPFNFYNNCASRQPTACVEHPARNRANRDGMCGLVMMAVGMTNLFLGILDSIKVATENGPTLHGLGKSPDILLACDFAD